MSQIALIRSVSVIMGTHLRATERHLPYGTTPYYPPPDTGEHTPPSPLYSHTFTYLAEMEGWVDLGGWLYTEMVYLSTDSQSPIQVLTTW